MPADRYLANVAALGGNTVSKLSNMCVGVVGNNSTAQSVIYNLIGLGVGAIEHITASDELSTGIVERLAHAIRPAVTSLDDALFLISPNVSYTQVQRPASASLILNTTNDARCAASKLKKFVGDIPVIYGRELDSQFAHANNYRALHSLLVGSLLADEARKYAGFVSKYEQQLQSGDEVCVDIASLLHAQAKALVPAKLDTVLVIGAGGLGTYCTYVLANRGVSQIILCEPDVVEETNLNRQLFYTGCVGKHKATVLAQRLSTPRSKIVARNEFFDRNFSLNNGEQKIDARIDAIFCCTDTLESRIEADAYAVAHNVPLVEGACTPTMGSLTTYVPGQSRTVAQQRYLSELLRLQDKSKLDSNVSTHATLTSTADSIVTSCTRVANPSVIGPNVLIGALQAISLDAKFDASGVSIATYPQLFLNLLRNQKFSQGGV